MSAEKFYQVLGERSEGRGRGENERCKGDEVK
jgi:hypothetical protein